MATETTTHVLVCVHVCGLVLTLAQGYCGSRTAECEGCHKQIVLRDMDRHTSLDCEVLCAHLPHVQERVALEAARKQAQEQIQALEGPAGGARRGRGARRGNGRPNGPRSEAQLSAALGAAALGTGASIRASERRLGDLLETAQLQSALLESALGSHRVERAVARVDEEGEELGTFSFFQHQAFPNKPEGGRRGGGGRGGGGLGPVVCDARRERGPDASCVPPQLHWWLVRSVLPTKEVQTRPCPRFVRCGTR